MELSGIAERLIQKELFSDYAEIAKVLGRSKTSSFRAVKELERTGHLRIEAVRAIRVLPPTRKPKTKRKQALQPD